MAMAPGGTVGLGLAGHQHVEPGDDHHVPRMVHNEAGGTGTVVGGQVGAQGQHTPLVLVENDVFYRFSHRVFNHHVSAIGAF